MGTGDPFLPDCCFRFRIGNETRIGYNLDLHKVDCPLSGAEKFAMKLVGDLLAAAIKIHSSFLFSYISFSLCSCISTCMVVQENVSGARESRVNDSGQFRSLISLHPCWIGLAMFLFASLSQAACPAYPYNKQYEWTYDWLLRS